MWTVDTVGYSVQSCWLLQFLLKAETPDFEEGGGREGGGREGGRKVRDIKIPKPVLNR